MMRFKDKVVIVTGAARGIGQAIAAGFGKEGAAIVIADILVAEGENTADSIKQQGSESVFIKTDVSSKADVDHLIDLTVQKFGVIDVLINVAGICPFKDFLEIPEAMWDRVLDVNLKGFFLCSQAVAKVMVDKGIHGRIVSISSISSIVGGAQQAHYCSTKAGINLLNASMAIALGPHGITCNVVMPGPVETDINKSDLADAKKREYFINRTPLRRIGQPQDIIGPVMFFASDDAAWCTGSTLVADGGILVNFQ
jgi:L-rhamnose 1-dehydrogenase